MSEKKKALITGITGQDGGYLAQLLLKEGYEVYGMVRRTTTMYNRRWIDSLDVKLIYGDMLDGTSIEKIMKEVKPDEIYNLAAQSHVGISFQIPEYTSNVNGIGVIRLLEAMRKTVPLARFYQASTSEMFGKGVEETDELSPFSVSSPYAISKLFAHNICEVYKEAYDLFICCGILFNHESPRRPLNFVTRKISNTIAKIHLRKTDTLALGNILSQRDWGFAGDYVEAMWLMLQHDIPDNYVIATGQTHTVKQFIDEACKCIGLDISWNGRPATGALGIISDSLLGRPDFARVVVNPKYYRPIDVTFLKGNSAKAKRVLGWKPKVSFKELVQMMVHRDVTLESEKMWNDRR